MLKNRYELKCIASLVLTLMAGLVSANTPAAESVSDVPGIAALSQASIHSKKAQSSVMLSVVAAGNRLVAVGERGIVLLSDDGAKTWRQANVPVSTTLTAVQFIDARDGWAVGHLGVVLHTADGGENWQKQLDGIQVGKLTQAEVERMSGATPEQIKFSDRLMTDGPDKPFLDVFFLSATTGYLVGAGNMVLRTDDGGKSWQPWMFHIDNPNSLNIYGIHSSGGAIFLVGERGLLLRSTDQGATFERLKSPYKGSYFGLVAAGDNALLTYGLRGNAFWSGDKGESWKKIETHIDVGLAAGTLLADGSLVLASQTGDILISRDRGQSFSPVKVKEAIPVTGMAASFKDALMTVGVLGVRSALIAVESH